MVTQILPAPDFFGRNRQETRDRPDKPRSQPVRAGSALKVTPEV
jgi:hypothetical protein